MNALSATSILTAIAALGSSALIGCANATPDPKNPVSANEVSGPNAAKGQGSCSAAACGAKTDKPADAKGEGSCSAAACGAKPGAAPTTTPASDKTDAKDDSKPADGTPGKPDDKKVDDKKKVVKKKGGGGAGAGACGAGTCSAAAPVKAPGARK